MNHKSETQMEKKMLSYHNDQTVKDKYLTRVRAHQAADNLIRGKGWTGTKGCAVGCTLEKYDHSRYPIEIGLPIWLARLEDSLFEGMSFEKSKIFPEKFLEVIPVGVDLEPVKWKFCEFIMRECLKTVENLKIDEALKSQVLKAIEGVRVLHQTAIETGKWPAAAWRIAADADAAADDADDAWRTAAVADAADVAAWRIAADAAAAAADAAAAAAAAWRETRVKSYDKYADELLRLLAEAK